MKFHWNCAYCTCHMHQVLYLFVSYKLLCVCVSLTSLVYEPCHVVMSCLCIVCKVGHFLPHRWALLLPQFDCQSMIIHIALTLLCVHQWRHLASKYFCSNCLPKVSLGKFCRLLMVNKKNNSVTGVITLVVLFKDNAQDFSTHSLLNSGQFQDSGFVVCLVSS